MLFPTRRISTSPFPCSLDKYDVQVDQNGLELFLFQDSQKKIFLQRLLSLTTILRCSLYSITSFFWLSFHSFVF